MKIHETCSFFRVSLATSALALIQFAAVVGEAATQEKKAVEWTGQGQFRLLVRVASVKLEDRASDELPAELEIDFVGELAKLGVDRLPDLRRVQVMKFDPETGQPERYGDYAYGKSEFDRPFRWLDHCVPYQFPEFQGPVSRSGGKIIRRDRIRGGYFLQTLGQWRRGRLTWTHTQAGANDSWYAIYFDVLPQGAEPPGAPPRGWIGDGLPRCDRLGATTTGADHSRVELDDWDGDGLIDLIVGENYGHVLWWPNRGSRKAPRFPFARYVFDADGLPLDAGQACAPKVVDWDGDGVKDLLVGAQRNRILFYRNRGTNQRRKLVYEGPLVLNENKTGQKDQKDLRDRRDEEDQSEGEPATTGFLGGKRPLELPVAPLARGSPDVFTIDYLPILEIADWDADGDVDLLAGGYITGLIFFYENTRRDSTGLPILAYRGPLRADGKPLNVQYWCAAPCAADFDGDGDLDLMSGRFPMYERNEDRAQDDFLRYYENVGSPGKPDLRARRFPNEGEFPRAYLATPRAHDWDDDGDLDLVVSSRCNIFLFRNSGSPQKPSFQAHSTPLPSSWGSSSIVVDRFLDFDGDGLVDIVTDYEVKLNSGDGNPWRWDESVSLLPAGQFIEHPSGIGDDWFWPYITDFDGDGRFDVLFGDWRGHVWFHRNLSSETQTQFDIEGRRLKLLDGKPIKVGPIGEDPSQSFVALQGARTVLTAADFDRDGLNDLVVGDTYGKVRYFQNAGTKTEPVFAKPVEVGDLGIRLLVDSSDWNGDGRMDVIAGAANGRVRVFLNKGDSSSARFAEGFDPKLPPLEQPRVLMVDLNGDGDEDLFVPSIQGSCFIERSFLKHGYAAAVLTAVERKE